MTVTGVAAPILGRMRDKAFAEDAKWTIRLKGRQYYLVSEKQSVRIPVGEKILEMTWERAQEIIKGKPKTSQKRKKKA